MEILTAQMNLIIVNLKNLFIPEVNLNEQIPLSVGLKSVSVANEIAERFEMKNRVLKDTPSVGGFKMSQENLKKRTFSNQNQNESGYNNYDSTNFVSSTSNIFYL